MGATTSGVGISSNCQHEVWPGFANSISYHVNDLWATVAHANNVNSVQDNDLNFMQRPRRLYAVPAAGGTRLWDSGDYRYDEAGNVLRTGSGYFLYDKVSRVKDGHISTLPLGGDTLASQTTSYDAFGNVQSLLGTSGRNTPTDSQTNRLCSGACPGTCGAGCGGTASYNAAGELLGWNFQSYEYDQFHMLQRSRLGAEDWLHFYTADDERVWSYRVGGSTYNRWTLRGLDGQVLREYASDSAGWRVISDYVYRDGQLLAAATPAETKQLHLDHLGTPRAITNAAGARTSFHAYYPFSEEATSSTQDTERLRFTGHETDFNAQVGSAQADDLTYMHARHFSPLTGRFLSTDPSQTSVDPKKPQSWNRYAYALDNSLKYVDRDGQAWVSTATDPEEQARQHELFRSMVEAGLPGPSAMAVGPRVAGLLGTRLGGLLSRLPGVGNLFTRAAAAEGVAVARNVVTGGTLSHALQANKLSHIFGNAGHGLDTLVGRFGSESAVTREVVGALGRAGTISVDSKGLFSVLIKVGDQLLRVEGAVVNGVLKIGTFYVARRPV